MIEDWWLFGLLIGDCWLAIERNRSYLNLSGGHGIGFWRIEKRTKDFAHRCVKLAISLPRTTQGKHIESQLIRCSTSVASNYRASLHAQSKAAFIAKISIVVEEADESEFWLEFIIDEKLMSKKRILPLLNEAHELSSIFITTRKTAQKGKKSTINNQQSTIKKWSTWTIFHFHNHKKDSSEKEKINNHKS